MPAEPHGGRDRQNPSSTSRSAPTAIRSSPAVRNSWILRAVSSVSRRSSGRSPSPAGNSSRRRGERSPRLNLQPLSPFAPSRQRTAAPRADLAAILCQRRRSRCSTANRRRGCHSVSCPLSESLGGSEVAGPVLVMHGQRNARLLLQPPPRPLVVPATAATRRPPRHGVAHVGSGGLAAAAPRPALLESRRLGLRGDSR